MEQVFAVRRNAFFGDEWPHGFVPLDQTQGHQLLERLQRGGQFVPRGPAEQDPAWKQLIPYCIVTSGAQVFVVERRSAQSEQRLHGRLSIGIGGHIEPQDDTETPLFQTALRRELGEELFIPQLESFSLEFLGLLNDDTTDVGKVHAGLVYRLEIPASGEPSTPNVRVREISKMVGCLEPLPTEGFGSTGPETPSKTRVVETANLWQDPARFESWSRILIESSFWREPGAHRSEPVRQKIRREEPHNG